MSTLMKHTAGWEGHIAVCLQGKNVASHFGAAEAVAVYTVTEGTLTDRQHLREPEMLQSLAETLHRHAVDVLVVGRIGSRALGALNRRGIRVIQGAAGPAEAAAVQLVASGLGQGRERCSGVCCRRCRSRGAKARCGDDS